MQKTIELRFNANDIAEGIRNFINKDGEYADRNDFYDFYLECSDKANNVAINKQKNTESDVVNLQYLFCFAELLLNNNIKFKFTFEFNKGEISERYYFSLRKAASLYVRQHENHIEDKLFARKSDGVRRLIGKEALKGYDVDEAIGIGRILPLIPITEINYKALMKINSINIFNSDLRQKEKKDACAYFNELYKEYYKAILLYEYEKELSKDLSGLIQSGEREKVANAIIKKYNLFNDDKGQELLLSVSEFVMSRLQYMELNKDSSIEKVAVNSKLSYDDIVKEINRIFENHITSTLLGVKKNIDSQNIKRSLLQKASQEGVSQAKEIIISKVNSYINDFSEFLVNNGYNKIIEQCAAREHNDILMFLYEDTVLDSLIFISTLYYIACYNYTEKAAQKASLLPQKINIKDIELLHETCVDYAQGVMQLIENAYKHAVYGGNGAANFTIRIRTFEDAKNLYLKEPDNFSNANHFMELYITDLQFDKFKGIKTKFIENVKRQCNDSEWEEFWKHRFKSSASSSDWDKFKHDILCDDSKFIGSISLSGLFTGAGEELNRYLSMHHNVVFHYGLQILDNVIRGADGYFQVVSMDDNAKSGCEEDGIYAIESESYDVNKMSWENGTAYVIYLPIRHTVPINYSDTVAAVDCNVGDGYSHINIAVEWDELMQSSEIGHPTDDKLKTVQSIIDHILSKNASINNKCTITEEKINQTIYCINCDKVHGEWFELLAKSLFMLLEQECFIPKHIALINVENSYSVVKLFRHFALFYNREGKSNVFKEKSVFIVDKQAEIDLLLSSKIAEIVKDLYKYQIDGSMNERAMNIIKHLGGGRNDGRQNG